MQRININLPDETYDSLKIQAAKERTTMTALILGKLGEVQEKHKTVPLEKVIEKTSHFCKHGSMKGLCKHGCK
jgi:hypothetical protein